MNERYEYAICQSVAEMEKAKADGWNFVCLIAGRERGVEPAAGAAVSNGAVREKDISESELNNVVDRVLCRVLRADRDDDEDGAGRVRRCVGRMVLERCVEKSLHGAEWRADADSQIDGIVDELMRHGISHKAWIGKMAEKWFMKNHRAASKITELRKERAGYKRKNKKKKDDKHRRDNAPGSVGEHVQPAGESSARASGAGADRS